jgi:hypothetical protein
MMLFESYGCYDEGRVCMPQKWAGMMECKTGLVVAGMGVLLSVMGGCAGHTPKPEPTMTQDQIRSHADKAFERLQQEEKNRAVDSGVGPY